MGRDASLVAQLHAALVKRPRFSKLPLDVLEPLADESMAHDHVRIRGTGMLLRVPKRSRRPLDAFGNLAYEAACYDRAGASGHVPRIHGALAPANDLPHGALIVDEIHGRPPILPDDLRALVAALASIHGLPVPPTNRRRPLIDLADPVADLLTEIDGEAIYLPEAGLGADVLAAILAELAAARPSLPLHDHPAATLIAFDANPRNFLIDGDGRAFLVDLEKARYGAPGLDLAHATLYTSTTWDAASYAVLSHDEMADAYGDWLAAVPPRVAADWRPWLMPLRRVKWLWSITACAKWRVMNRQAPDSGGQNGTTDLVDRVADRVDHYLSPEGVDRVRTDWRSDNGLTRLLGPLD